MVESSFWFSYLQLRFGVLYLPSHFYPNYMFNQCKSIEETSATKLIR